MKTKLRNNLARLLILSVTFLNLQCAIQFLLTPGYYSPGFELTGSVGDAMIRGFGLLFIMWNVPYVIALINPVKYRVSLIEAVVMQFIGAAGETIVLLTLPGNHPVLNGSVIRFIIFDSAGFVVLLAALLLVLRRSTEE